ncbi:hypothetical protein A8990_13228 [Paenibacillus taihuensis]|uniref:Uncharacterized protein n=1 Tax=Paenibacillus taihuensis TaxID=1156355 RepID=A0A3D9QW90_9BACL|nr:hypothetical protein [Paenibacillus taihuensis]REE69631.1 hypothetical protein A8990_13228 [Paenibacillus taihuensis]
MLPKNYFALIIMIWITVLTIWAVNKVVVPLNNNDVMVQGIPIQPMPQEISTVQIDKDTVWIIDANSNYIKVITHDKDGYHITGSEMTYQSIVSR